MKAEETFGDMMKRARTEKGLSLRQLQKETGIQWSLLQMIESATRPATLNVAYLIAKELSLEKEAALEAAYRGRVSHCLDREQRALVAFAKKKRVHLREVLPIVDK